MKLVLLTVFTYACTALLVYMGYITYLAGNMNGMVATAILGAMSLAGAIMGTIGICNALR